MSDFFSILSDLRAKKQYNRYDFQIHGLEIAKKLNDNKHKALYIKLARENEKQLLDRAVSYILESKTLNKNSIHTLFIWQVNELKKLPVKKMAIVLRPKTKSDLNKINAYVTLPIIKNFKHKDKFYFFKEENFNIILFYCENFLTDEIKLLTKIKDEVEQKYIKDESTKIIEKIVDLPEPINLGNTKKPIDKNIKQVFSDFTFNLNEIFFYQTKGIIFKFKNPLFYRVFNTIKSSLKENKVKSKYLDFYKKRPNFYLKIASLKKEFYNVLDYKEVTESLNKILNNLNLEINFKLDVLEIKKEYKKNNSQ